MRWKIQFWDIQWAGAVVGRELPGHPRDLEIIVFADSEQTAIDYALKKTSDDYGTQIISVGITEVDELPEPHRDDLD